MELKHHQLSWHFLYDLPEYFLQYQYSALAEAKTASLAFSPMTSQFYTHTLLIRKCQVVNLVNDGQNFQIIVQG